MSNPLSTQQFAKKSNAKIPLVTVRLDRVHATQYYLDQAKVKDIAQRGATDGTPPLVARYKPPGAKRYEYGMIDGHHRFGAALEQGLDRMPVRLVR